MVSFYSFHEEWARDITETGCSTDNEFHSKLTRTSSVLGKQLVPGNNVAIHTVSTIHVVEVYGTEKDVVGISDSHLPG